MLVKFCMIRRLWCASCSIKAYTITHEFRTAESLREIINIAWCLALGLEERRGLN